jgi:hypothetical protein
MVKQNAQAGGDTPIGTNRPDLFFSLSKTSVPDRDEAHTDQKTRGRDKDKVGRVHTQGTLTRGARFRLLLGSLSADAFR